MTRRLPPRPSMQQILRNERLDDHPPPSYRGVPAARRMADLTPPDPARREDIPDPGGSVSTALDPRSD